MIFLVKSVSICASFEYINPYLLRNAKIEIGNELAKIFFDMEMECFSNKRTQCCVVKGLRIQGSKFNSLKFKVFLERQVVIFIIFFR